MPVCIHNALSRELGSGILLAPLLAANLVERVEGSVVGSPHCSQWVQLPRLNKPLTEGMLDCWSRRRRKHRKMCVRVPDFRRLERSALRRQALALVLNVHS